MAKRKCDNCNKPLGSTKDKCHSCGGESIRADNAGTYRNTSLYELLRKFGI